jgi:hypothetical protein
MRDDRREPGAEQHRQLRRAQRQREHRRAAQDAQPGRPRRARRETSDRLEDHREDHRLHAVEEPADRRHRVVANVGPGQRAGEQHRRRDERDARDQQPGPAPPLVADVDRQLGRVRPRDQVGRAHQIEERRVGEPAAAPHDVLAHHRDVRRRSAERRGAEAQEQARQLTERRALRG